MLLLRKPLPETMRRFLQAQQPLAFTYPVPGTTASAPLPGYVVDHTRTLLGKGEKVYRAARAALERWEQFQLDWVEAWPRETKLSPGEVIAVLARLPGVWWLNACRIVYTEDLTGPIARFGFAYGTLPGHVERGEERFRIEWERSSGLVWYDVLAYSRPRHLLARLGYPFTRRCQKRFARDSAVAMRRATSLVKV